MPVGRPREFDSERALDAAMHLFWRKGYESTSMQDLLDSMQLSKSSLYQTYGSKHELFQQCINYYRDMMTTGLSRSLDEAGSGRGFIEAVFNGMVASAEKSTDQIGCLVMNTASEFAQRDKDISKLIVLATEKFSSVLLRAVEQAQLAGEIPADKNAQNLAHFLLSSMSGMNNMIKAGLDKVSVQGIANEILNALD